MIHFELAPNSAKVDDHVFVIVKVLKTDKRGNRRESRGFKREDYEVVEAVISQIHFGWSMLSSENTWSCALSTIGDNPATWRYIQDVSLSDCFTSRKEAEKELDRRFADEE